MSRLNHTLNRFRAVHTVNGSLPLTQVEAHDALQAIAHEFSIYEVETAELYAFGDRVRQILAEEESSRDQLEKIASHLIGLSGRISEQVRELTSGRKSVIPVGTERVALESADWPIG
jgi:hypothetical protein